MAKPFNEYLRQTVGKFDRLNRTAEDRLGLVIYCSLEQLETAVAEFAQWYNHQRYHEALGNLRPADIYYGRAEAIQARRKEVRTRTFETRRKYNLGLHCQANGVTVDPGG